MNSLPEPPAAPAAADTPAASPPAPAAQAPRRSAASVIVWLALVLAAGAALAAAWFAWTAQTRVRELEAELVKRQQASQDQAAEARLAARQAEESARESAAKLALLEVRVAESAIQRSQIEELMQSVARSRDENVLADVEAALRVAMQQGAITGSAEPLMAALKQAEDRLTRYSEPQLERVRRAIGTDLERLKAVAVTDIAALTVRLDEAIRLVDELPLLAQPPRRAGARPASATAATAPASAASSAASGGPWAERWQALGALVWNEVRSLVRVTPIEQPEAMLIAPDQTYFLRENLKLRLLNARLALLSRQFDTAQGDLRDARAALERYFDPGARAVKSAGELVRQVASQARLVIVPRPDATLAAIAAATARR